MHFKAKQVLKIPKSSFLIPTNQFLLSLLRLKEEELLIKNKMH